MAGAKEVHSVICSNVLTAIVPIVLPSLEVSIKLNDIYDTLDVRPRPRLQVVKIGPTDT